MRSDTSLHFIQYALNIDAIRFGDTELKSRRISPYFVNTGAFDDGDKLNQLTRFYTDTIRESAPEFDMLFGPAYKGIALASSIAVRFAANYGRTVPYASNRKETKDHGEGGDVLGAPIAGRVLVVDDALTTADSARQAFEFIRARGATPVGLTVAFNRNESVWEGGPTAAQHVMNTCGLPVSAVSSVNDLCEYLQYQPPHSSDLQKIREYQRRYGPSAAAAIA